jgi:hypothetical protein
MSKRPSTAQYFEEVMNRPRPSFFSMIFRLALIVIGLPVIMIVTLPILAWVFVGHH